MLEIRIVLKNRYVIKESAMLKEQYQSNVQLEK